MSKRDLAAKSQQPGQFWLVGIRLDPNFPEPDFFTLLREEPAHWPIVYKGQIIFFHEAEAAQAALNFYLRHSNLQPSRAPDEPTLIVDFAQGLYLLSSESRDDASYLLNICNVLFDMLKAASIALPAMYRADLYELADHLTFSKEFASFLNEQRLERSELIEALQWALGAVMTKAMFFPKATSNNCP